MPDGVLGGILTANNIARLDLSGTEMVVLLSLSVGTRQGYFRRSLRLAACLQESGVGTMVMALWSVSDKVATEFMTAFYEQLASKQCKWNKRKALKTQSPSFGRNIPTHTIGRHL